jgi:tRNA (guanine9-N1)-methyltransferase
MSDFNNLDPPLEGMNVQSDITRPKRLPRSAKKRLSRELKHARKLAEREERKEKEAEKFINKTEATIVLKSPKEINEETLKLLDSKSQGLPRIFINCSFCDTMAGKEITSLVKQIQLSYAALRKSVLFDKGPRAQINVTSVEPDSEFSKKLKEQNSEKWHVNFYKENYWDILNSENARPTKVVVLCPDATEVLEAVDLDSVYILGGLVDRTVQSKISYNQTSQLVLSEKNSENKFSLKICRLPIREHISCPKSTVLNINTVIEILLKMLIPGADWSEVLKKCVPKRKQEPVLKRG